MRTPIYFRRGNKVDLPALNVGEPGFATDTKEIFIGASGGNIKLMQWLSGGQKVQSGTTTITTDASGNGIASITFPATFTTTPIIVATIKHRGTYETASVFYGSESPPAFTIHIKGAVSVTYTVSWEAIGS